MKNTLREAVREIISDDALFRQREIPGDADEPTSDCGGDCGCETCSGGEDYVTPKYALYSMIGDAIGLYDDMDDDAFDDDEENELIMKIAEVIRRLKNE